MNTKTTLIWGAVALNAIGCAMEIVYTQDVGWICFFVLATAASLYVAFTNEEE